MGGGPTIEQPELSPEEKELLATQNELLLQQKAITQQSLQQQQLIAPFIFAELGLIPTFDDAGVLTGFTQTEEEIQQRALREEIETAQLERSRAALAGELPVNPALLSDLEEEESTIRENLRKRLGTEFETSTPGIETLGDFFERKESILEGARRGDLTLTESLSLARESSSGFRLEALSGFGGGRALLPFAGAAGQAAAGFQGPLSVFANLRQQQLQANIANAQNRSTFGDIFGPLLGAAATLGGAAILGGGGAAGGATGFGFLPFAGSDRRIKKNIRKVGKLDNGLSVYAYQFRSGGPTQVGVMAQDVEIVNPEAVVEIGGIKHVDYDKAVL